MFSWADTPGPQEERRAFDDSVTTSLRDALGPKWANVVKEEPVKQWMDFFEPHILRGTTRLTVRFWANNIWEVSKSRAIKLFHPHWC